MIISLFIHPKMYKPAMKKNQIYIYLAKNQTNQANQTKKKFALRHPINENLQRQCVQSHGRFETVSPCKENSKKATPRASEIQQSIAQPTVLKNSEKNLKLS